MSDVFVGDYAGVLCFVFDCFFVWFGLLVLNFGFFWVDLFVCGCCFGGWWFRLILLSLVWVVFTVFVVLAMLFSL